MNSYFIKLYNSTIFTCEMTSNELYILTRNAEDEQPYQKDDFWEWFKQKIEYDGEALCFIIATDEDTFEVCSTLQIAQKQILSKLDLENILVGQIDENSNTKFLPHVDLTIVKCSVDEKNPQSIQSYYQKQTFLHKRK